MMQITTRTWILKLSLLYIKVLVTCFSFASYTFVPFELVVKSATIDRISLYIFYGVFSLFIDSAAIRLFFSEPFYLRYPTKKSWICHLLAFIARQQGSTVLIVSVFLLINAVLFRFPIQFSGKILLCLFSLWLYLATLHLLVTLLIFGFGRFGPPVVIGFAFNLVCLVLGHQEVIKLDEAPSVLVFLSLMAALLLLLLLRSRRLELYKNRDVRFSNGS